MRTVYWMFPALMAVAACAPGAGQGESRLDTLESAPMPRAELLVHFADIARGLCRKEKFLDSVQKDPETCLAHLERALPACGQALLPELPEKVADKTIARDAGKRLLRCALP